MTARVLVAPDKFKGSCSARRAAEAIVSGLRDVWGDAVAYEILPLADGGEGTVDAFLDAGAQRREAHVPGPLGEPVAAVYAVAGDVAVLEMASASGLALLGGRRAPLDASTAGTGELIRHALDGGARRIVVGLGGSATTDGGAGALAVLGVVFRDPAGDVLTPIPSQLNRLATIDASGLDPRLAGTAIDLACDVDNPLLGPRGAAAVYGPQKGASGAQVGFLDDALGRLAAAAVSATGRDLRDQPGAGAAGGLGWGLATFAGARFARGFDLIAGLRGLPQRLPGASLCITGEGRIDEQSLGGKVVGGVAALGRTAGVAVVALGGSVDPAAEARLWELGTACLAIAAGPLDLEGSMRDAPALIRGAAARLARLRPRPA